MGGSLGIVNDTKHTAPNVYVLYSASIAKDLFAETKVIDNNVLRQKNNDFVDEFNKNDVIVLSTAGPTLGKDISFVKKYV